MSDLENRIEKLEQRTGASSKSPVTLVVVYDGQNPTEAEKEAAIEAYKAKNPDWEGKDINVIYVTSEKAKELTERVIAGEGTE